MTSIGSRLLQAEAFALTAAAAATGLLVISGDARALAPGGLVDGLLVLLILSVGALTAGFAGRQLQGQQRLPRFAALHVLTVTAVTITVITDDWLVLAAAWSIAGLALTGLVDHAGTPTTAAAARAIRRRLLPGDLALWAAAAIAATTQATRDLDAVPEGAAATAMAVLVVCAGIVRSALVPAHRWLPATAEAPTPVSALLHAGFVNGAGVLVLAAWPLMSSQPVALLLLVVAGALSAAAGTLLARRRVDAKGKLACSTTAQMGYMALTAGIGLPAAAAFHLVGHGLYKASRFLGVGETVARAAAAQGRPAVTRRPVLVALTAATAVAVAGAITVGWHTAGLPWAGPVELLPPTVAVLAVIAVAAKSGSARVSVAALASLAGYLGLLGAWTWAVNGTATDAASPDGAGATTAVWPEPAQWMLLAALAATALATGLAGRLLASGKAPRWEATAALSALPLADHRLPSLRSRIAPRQADAVSDADRARAQAEADLAGDVVGPMWPLTSAVAVNPLAGLERLHVDDARAVAAELWAAPGAGSDWSRQTMLDLLDAADGGRLAAVADHHSSLWCAWIWGGGQTGLFAQWRQLAGTRAAERRLGLAGFGDLLRDLPSDPAAALALLLDEAKVAPGARIGYLARTLGRLPGWAAHASWRDRTGLRDGITDLLAMRIAYDVAIARAAAEERLGPDAGWPEIAAAAGADAGFRSWAAAPTLADAAARMERRAAAEESFRSPLVAAISAAASKEGARSTAPRAQLVGCIDVRSERLRRHLEATGRYETLGFAGFFGVPFRYADPTGTVTDQCPVLLTPRTPVTAAPGADPEAAATALRGAESTTVAPFAVAEATGIVHGLLAALRTAAPGLAARSRARRRVPLGRLDLTAFSTDEQVFLSEAALRAMGLVDRFAPLLLLVGHRGGAANNPYAAAYDCGACGGHGGGVNAAVLARFLNDGIVRGRLAARGIVIPEATWVVALEHNTTTDRVTLVAPDDVSDSHRPAVAEALADLATAGAAAARERMDLIPDAPPSATRSAALRHAASRSADWAQVRPEWGLAGNAAFVVGARRLTADLDLQGRVFLHSYDPAVDADGAALEVILTAPLVVAHWINAQYSFSSDQPGRFGAGDKARHNPVAGLGVLLGAAGDLRVGLPWQALFAEDPAMPDARPIFEPLRLLAVVHADPAVITRIIERQPVLQRLFGNEWVALTAIDPADGMPWRYRPSGGWQYGQTDRRPAAATVTEVAA